MIEKNIIDTNEYKLFLDMTSIYYKDDGYYKLFYSNDYPVPYQKEIEVEILEDNSEENNEETKNDKIKNKEIKTIYLYPITVGQYELFANMCDVLIMDEDKMQGSDYTTIKMTYLDYLLYKSTKKNESGIDNRIIISKLLKLMSLVTHFPIDKINLILIEGKLYLQINEVNYDAKDFDIIRRIICDQNCIELPDLKIHPDIKRKIREAEALRNKHSKNKRCSFEDMKSRVSGRTGFTCKEINQMTIREFSKLIESLDIIVSYDLETALSPYMEKKDQNNIKHWLSEATKVDRFKENSTNTAEIMSKLGGNKPN